MNQIIDDEQLLARFRQWLAETRAAAEQVATAGHASLPDSGDGALNTAPIVMAPPSGVGLYRLAEEFTALRQEVKLQTRSARGLEEDIEKLLVALRQSIAALESIKPQERQAAWSAGQGLALALAELDEAIDRGRQQLERSGLRLIEAPDETLLAELERAYASQSWLPRLLSRSYHRRVQAVVAQSAARSQRQALLAALLDGYDLIQQRLARALSTAGIVRIAAIGHTVDPDQMIVLGIVESDSPPGTVIEEIRRGYTWNGRLLRYAEVRASRMTDE